MFPVVPRPSAFALTTERGKHAHKVVLGRSRIALSFYHIKALFKGTFCKKVETRLAKSGITLVHTGHIMEECSKIKIQKPRLCILTTIIHIVRTPERGFVVVRIAPLVLGGNVPDGAEHKKLCHTDAHF